MHELDEEPLPSPTQLHFEDLASQRDEMDFAGMSILLINSWPIAKSRSFTSDTDPVSMAYDTPDNIMSDDMQVDQPSDFTAATSASNNASVDIHHHFIETHPLINGN